MEPKSINDYRDEIFENKKKFLKYNTIRLQKLTGSLLNKKIINLIDFLPLLITSNHPDLPGFVENFTPIGIHGYSPGISANNFIQSTFPTVQPSQLLSDYKSIKPLIEVFAIMGSAGSIAYNEESDIDFWICLNEKKVGIESVNSLMVKLREIELWITENFNMETYFFVNDIERVRNDLFDSSEDSFAGKANGKLLKDEFYRSSILLEGKIPFWWVVPSGIDDDSYEKYFGTLKRMEFERDYVDFGNLCNIDKGDFLGGGLFQILKSLGNPFKSIIKMGTLERYLLDEKSETPLLCNIIKKNVQDNKLGINDIDPYILMFNHVCDYYSGKKDPDLLTSHEIIKMCFYIKIDPNLSEYTSLNIEDIKSENIKKMLEYVKSWNWLDAKIKQMDNFKNWDITPINKFWNNITKQILKSYKRILENIKHDKIDQKFSDEDIKYITRKIQSSFSFSENKIKNAVSFKDNPIEKHLVIESVNEKDGSINWLLSKGFKSQHANSERVVTHREPTLIALLAWISMNRMFQKDHTRVEIKSRFHLLDSGFIRDLMNELTLYFSIKRLNIQNEYFAKDPFPLLNFIIINLYSKYPKGIEDIFYLYHNSWGETVYEKYENETDLSIIILKLLNGALYNRQDYKSCVRITSPYPYGTSKPFKAIQYLFEDIYNLFISTEPNEATEKRYITILGNSFTVFSYRTLQGKGRIICNIYKSELQMLYSLSSIFGRKNIIRVDPFYSELNYLRTINENHKEEAIQIYYQRERKYCYFFISDEQGAIIFHRESADCFIDYLTRLYIFSNNVAKRIVENNPGSPLKLSKKNVILYELKRDNRNDCSVNEINPELQKDILEHRKFVMPFKVSLSLLTNRDVGYCFSLPYGGVSNIFSKSETGKIARDLLVYMGSAKGYNYFITDIDLTDLDHIIYKNVTSFSFAEKNRFELLMEKTTKSSNK